MNIRVFKDDNYGWRASLDYGDVLCVPDEWGEKYFRVKEEFDKLTDELSLMSIEKGLS